MGVGENLYSAQCIALTYERPFPVGAEGELLRDPYSGITYEWNPNTGTWTPINSTEMQVDWYVDPVAGNDANVGNLANPLATLQQAIDRIPPEVRHDINIRFVDGGNPLVIDEHIRITNLNVGARIRIIGNNRLAVIPAGIQVFAPFPANTGDYWSLTIPGAGWVPGSLVGMFVRFTAGPRAGTDSFIIDNDATTLWLGHRGDPFADGPYGPFDGGEIRENLETIQRTTGVLDFPTMEIANVVGSGIDITGFSGAKVLAFEGVNISGDNSLNFSVWAYGNVHVGFVGCCVSDGVQQFLPGSAIFTLLNSMAWTTRLGSAYTWFDTIQGPPEGSLDLLLYDTGIIGGINVGTRTRAQIARVNGIENILNPVGNLIRYYGSLLQLNNVGLDMKDSGPLCIAVSPGAYGLIDMQTTNLRRAQYAGLGPLEGSSALQNLMVRIDYNSGLFPSDIEGCWTYGIDATGVKIETWGPVASTIPNGFAGMRLRKGGFLRQNSSVPPTLSGPVPIATEIDFDDRGPTWFTNWGTSATGLQTLCHQQAIPPL